MRILICDDEEVYRKKEQKICEKIFRNNKDIQIISLESGEEIIEFEDPIDLLLLDIDMPGIDGITVKNYLQIRHPETIVLFITNHEERMREAFGMHVLGFVDKWKMEQEIPVYLEEFSKNLYSSRFIEGKDGEIYQSSDIRYIKAGGKNYIQMFTKTGTHNLFRANLKDILAVLEEVDFIQPHREYLVNMREITEIDEREIFIGETKIPISIRRKTKVEKQYRDFQRRRMKYL